MPGKGLKGLAGILAALVLIASFGCGRGDEAENKPYIPLTTTTIEMIKDIEYGRVGERPLLLDIYRPQEPIASPIPAIVWIHGGGWRRGNKFPSRVATMAKYGFLGISIEYRLSGEAKFPAAVEDSKCAVRWLRANVDKYHVDPDRIGVWGGSAGAHLSMMVACADEHAGLEGNGGWEGVSSRVQAACSFFGPSDFVMAYEITRDRAAIQFIGSTLKEKPASYRLASPINHVTPDDPPLLMIHGDHDSTVPFEQSEIMYQAYQKAGIEVTLIKVTGAGHGFKPVTDNPISPSPQEINEIVLDFFLKHLVYSD